MKWNSLTKTQQMALYALGTLLFFIFGYSLGIGKEKNLVQGYFEKYDVINKRNPIYSFTSSSVGSDAPQATTLGLYENAYDDVTSIIEKEKKAGVLDDISFYYRDMNSATWFGYQEEEAFIPASLLKLLYALAAYKQEEEHPGFLSQRLQFTRDTYDIAASRSQPVETELAVGNWYSVEDLVKDMVINSDNSARDLLSGVIYEKYLNDLYYIIGIRTPELRKEYKISAKDYSLFLRILYNSKFISEEHSDHLLNLLAQSTFTDGLVSGVGDKIPVAHKFGSYVFNDAESPYQEIHDCGIIYYPDEPYLLCVMTKGKSQEDLVRIISDISKSIYQSHAREDL
jgi:beta-lactamase class A